MDFAKESISSVLQGSNKSDLKKVLPKILDEVDYYKTKTRKNIDAKYTDFLHQLPNNKTYIEDCESLIADGQVILHEDEEGTAPEETLSMANIELQQYKSEFRAICQEMETLKKILRVDTLLEEIERCTATNETLLVMGLLEELQLLLNAEDVVFRGLSCYDNINARFEKEKSDMDRRLRAQFSDLVQVTEKQFQTNKLVCLKLTTDVEKLREVTTALLATHYKPQHTCDFLMDNVFFPIMTRPVSLESQAGVDSLELRLSYSVKERTPEELKPKYHVVFRHLKTVLEALHAIEVFPLLGDMAGRFLGILTDECLMAAVPETMDDMKESTLQEDVLALNTFLMQTGFYGAERRELVKFSEQVDTLFHKKFSHGILNSASTIMRKDLSDIVLMATAEESGNSATSHKDSTDADLTVFPRCMVSKSTVELISLMSKILREIELLGSSAGGGGGGDSQERRIHLMSIVSVILDNYMSEVPLYHKKLLTRIPHLTALFYNNCQYLAFWVSKREAVLQMSPDSQILVNMKALGVKYLEEQVASQRTQILEIMREFDLNESLTEMSQAVYRCVRQCLRQMDLLKNVWQSILPDGCYNSNMGAILNDFIGEVLRRIMALEDIATPIANGLVDVISLIEERAPMVFADPLRIPIIVKAWAKLSQLKMILGASLLEITQHWAEGTGPLTMNFRADEIRHLVRALFQNTKRRADALATIV